MATHKNILVVFLILVSLPCRAGSVEFSISVNAQGLSENHASGSIHAPAEDVWDLLSQADGWKTFMPSVIESVFLSPDGIDAIQKASTHNASKIAIIAKRHAGGMSRITGQSWKTPLFMIIDAPFPVENRWLVIELTQDERKSKDRIYKQCWRMILGNVRSSEGCFLLSASQEGESLLVRDEKTDLGGHVPRWVTKVGTTIAVPQIYSRIEKKLRRLQKEPPRATR